MVLVNKNIRKLQMVMLPLIMLLLVLSFGFVVNAEAKIYKDEGNSNHYHYQGLKEGVYTFVASTPVYDKPGSDRKLIGQISDTLYPAGDNDIYYGGYKLIYTVESVEYADGKAYGEIRWFDPDQFGGPKSDFNPVYMKTGWVVLDERYGTKTHFTMNQTVSGTDMYLYYGVDGEQDTRMRAHPDIGKSVLNGKARITEDTFERNGPGTNFTYYNTGLYNVQHPKGDEVEVQYTIWNHKIKDKKLFDNSYASFSQNYPVGWCKLKNGRFVELSKIDFIDDYSTYVEDENTYEEWKFVFHRYTPPSAYYNEKIVQFYQSTKNNQDGKIDRTIQEVGKLTGPTLKVYSITYHDSDKLWYMHTDKGYLKLQDSNFMPDGSIQLPQYYITSGTNTYLDDDIYLRRTNIVNNGTVSSAEYTSEGKWAKSGKSTYSGITTERTYRTYEGSSYTGFKLGPGDIYPTTTPTSGYMYLIDIVNGCWGRFQCYDSDNVYEKTMYLDLSKNISAVTKMGSSDAQKVFGNAILLQSAEVGRPYTAKTLVEVHKIVTTQWGDVASCGYASQILGCIKTGDTVCVSNIRDMQGGTWGTVTLSDGRTGDVDMSYLQVKSDNITVSSIDIKSLTINPKAGSTANPDAKIDSSKQYEVSMQRWYRSGESAAFTSAFDWGNTYNYKLWVNPKAGYTFGEINTNIPISLNGVQIGTGKVVNRSGKNMVYFSFSKTFDTVDSIAIKISIPQRDYDVAAGVPASNYEGYEIVQQGWREGSESGSVATGTYKKATDYYYCALLKPKAGIKFVGTSGSILDLMDKAVVIDKKINTEYAVTKCYKYPDNDTEKPGYVYISIMFSTEKSSFSSYISVTGPTSPVAGAPIKSDAANVSASSVPYIDEQYWIDNLRAWVNSKAATTDSFFIPDKDYYHVTVVKVPDDWEFVVNQNGLIVNQVLLNDTDLEQIKYDELLSPSLSGRIDGDGIFFGDKDKVVIIKKYTPEVDESKKTGDCFWSFDSSTGTLYITGQGAMADYIKPEDDNMPWKEYRDRITDIVIGDGVIRIGEYAFSRSGVKSITVSDSVITIGNYAFYDCANLDTVTWGSGLRSIGNYAFVCNKDNNIKMKSLFIPDSVVSIGTYAVGFEYYRGRYILLDGFEISGACDSEAYNYAVNYSFPWKSTSHSGDSWVIDKDSTCTEKGSKSLVCSICGDTVTEEIDLKPHTLTKVAAKDATGSAEGNKEYYTCSICGKWFEDSEGTKEIADHNSVVIPIISGGAGNSINGSTAIPNNPVTTTDRTLQNNAKTPAKVILKSVKKLKGRKIKVTWKKASEVKGYEVQYSLNKKFKKAKTKTKTTNKNTLKIKKLKKGKIYYVRVRAYTVDAFGKKVPGEWSSMKKVKVK